MLSKTIIYDGTTKDFCNDVLTNKITGIMRDNFNNYFGRDVADSEFNSWQNSLQYVKNLVELADLKDNKIVLEYEVPYNTKRIDCMLFGKGQDNKSYAVVIELKQWSKVSAIEDEENFVETFTGGSLRKVPHPSEQVEGYHNHLLNFIEVFELDPDFDLFSCVYCHNYSKTEHTGLFDDTYSEVLGKFPIYAKEDVINFADKLKRLLSKGDGFEIFNRFMQSPIRPSKKLLENTAKIIENKAVFSLLNEQLVAKNVILSKVKRFDKKKEKSVVLVKGGPGTGKSVIALNILAEMAKRNKTVFYACKSKPFLEALKKTVGRDGKILFSNLNQFIPSRTDENQLDVLLVDEAHRIGKTSNFQFTKPQDRTDMPQIDQLIRCAKTSVFFIDDKQTVRGLEVGNTGLIRDAAEKFGCSVEEVELLSQFRCNGSDNYLDWLESMLGYSSKPKVLKEQDNFDFQIFSDPQEMYDVLKEKESNKLNSARLVAGFCWPWSKTLDENAELVKDVQVGNFAMPWETHGNITPPTGYVKWYEWAYKPEGIKQVGCIYTVQGFEFDYIGVIVGEDLQYDKENDCLTTDVSKTCDPTLKRNKDRFDTYAKNIYRVLMSRGMKGCYVHFVNKDVENYFRRFIDF